MEHLKRDIIEIGRWLWEKDLSAAASGNISVRLDSSRMLITGHGACLGVLKEGDIGALDLEGAVLETGFSPSTEKPFHLAVYKNLGVRCVVHVHPALTNGYFACRDTLEFDTFEARLVLGDVSVVDQKTPAITDISPVVAGLKRNNIIVLRHHGVVAIGETLRDAFFLIQTLEEAVRTNWIRDFYRAGAGSVALPPAAERAAEPAPAGEKHQLFSEGQIVKIVALVNADEKFRQLAHETALATKLAVVLDETQTAYCFDFKDGGIAGYSRSPAEAEFVISGKAEYWRAIFNRELDPFSATTQKKLKLKGDFAKISRWYVPFNRLFELWKNVPVE